MIRLFLISSILLAAGAQAATTVDAATAERFASLALACVHKEYPNKIAHVLSSDSDVQPPRKLTPAFYGCYDWHSSVHGHWLLARLVRTYPDAAFAAKARSALQQSITESSIAQEVRYLQGPGRASFERPYGLGWLLQLAAELREARDPMLRKLGTTLLPLESAAVARVKSWVPKLSHPVRSGEHSQSAFAFGLMLDYARVAGDKEFAALLERKIGEFYLGDRSCPLAYEPSGEDFLSPCIAEADVVRRVLSPVGYAAWLGGFLPGIPLDGASRWLQPEVVTDPSDPKLAHLDGLNLSRAWMLEGIASGLPERDPRVKAIRAAAAAHRDAGLRSVTGRHYEGGHWLGSFATYLVTRRGVDH